MRYKMVWETEHEVDGTDYATLEEAKACAIETLHSWMESQVIDNGYPMNPKEWNEEQIEEWDSMIYNCGVSVRDKTKYNDEDFGEIWEPSDEELKEIGWVLYEEMKQGF